MKHFYDKYRVELISEKYGHTILRLPPYHCKLNITEMIWNILKRYVTCKNKSFKLKQCEVFGNPRNRKNTSLKLHKTLLEM